jgi:hypothetical protein
LMMKKAAAQQITEKKVKAIIQNSRECPRDHLQANDLGVNSEPTLIKGKR